MKHLDWIATNIKNYIENILEKELSEIILVSGGSAWADHVAIQLFLTKEFAGLELYLPSKFDFKQKKYVNTHEGRTLNTLHQECAEKTQINILEEIARAVTTKGAKIVIKRGFTQRNTLIAQNCDHLLAFTFNESNGEPATGGTLDTWKKTKHQNRVHFDLGSA